MFTEVMVNCWAFQGKHFHLEVESGTDLITHFRDRLGLVDFYITCNGKIIDVDADLKSNGIYHVIPRLPGGKGGFGSMLRAIGAQIEKTTSREACRDLSGRRMRDVNNEKKLKEWISKKADREREKEEKRKERFERRRAVPNHKFDDPQYDQQKAKVKDNLEDALQAGLKKSSQATVSSSSTTSESRKRKSDSEIEHDRDLKKKAVEWLGMSVENLSDLDTSSDDSDSDTAQPSSSRSSSTSAQAEQSNEEEKEKRNADDTHEIEQKGESECITSADGQTSVDTNVSDEVKESESGLLTALKAIPPTSNQQQEAQIMDIFEPIDLDGFISAEQLKECGLERLKQDLISRGLKCGGTLDERASRLYSVKGLSSDQYPAALKAKPVKGKKR
ncbi:splicing regulator SDE2-like [Tubulanus polymorphus]|uniref:splicing regulator SDE2-like n=1 Tax=Tubulanus polymorphus TaxID=672921 RepID=UPI003DA2918C